MNSKERVLTAISHREPDRVPVDYIANSGIDKRIKKYFGIAEDDDEELYKTLNVDFRRVYPSYTGPELHTPEPGKRIGMWGIHTKWIEHETGGYWDYCDFPLKDATMEQMQNWPMPSPDDFDYEQIKKQCEKFADYFVMIGGEGVGDIINSTGMIRTMEQVMLDLGLDTPEFYTYVDRRLDIQIEMLYRSLEAAKGKIDLLFMGEDLGGQTGPLISKDMYRRILRPRHQKIVDLAKSFDLPVMMHSCGSSSWAFNDFIEMGINVVDTLQPEAANMQPEYLKKTYGDKLSFHGMISTAGPVAYGTPEQVRENVKNTLEIMKPGGGYCLSPTHLLQDNSPTENVVAMYDTVNKFGLY
jgi:uroporphyrinogen decarboxylase